MENTINAVNSLPLPLLSLLYFTLFLAVVNVGYLVYSAITRNWLKLKFGTVLLLFRAKKSIRLWFLRKPTTRYNMQEFPSSDSEIVLESLEERNPVQQSSSNIEQPSGVTQISETEWVYEIKGEKVMVKRLKNGRTVHIDIS